MFGGPPEGAVEVAEIAGVGAGVGSGWSDTRAVDVVGTDGLEQCVAGVGHVAVVATAAGRLFDVVGVLGQPAAGELGVTLQAGLVRTHGGFQLVIRPLTQGPWIVLRWMERVTAEA